MIRFYGHLSNDVLKKSSKKYGRNFITIVIIYILLFIVIPVVTGIVFNEAIKECILFSVMFLISGAIIFLVTISYEIRRDSYPEIIITEDTIKEAYYKNGYKEWRIARVKTVRKVIDAGDVYYVYRRFNDFTSALICQKSNIVEGSIEEFEQIFNGKIIKNINQIK